MINLRPFVGTPESNRYTDHEAVDIAKLEAACSRHKGKQVSATLFRRNPSIICKEVQ